MLRGTLGAALGAIAALACAAELAAAETGTISPAGAITATTTEFRWIAGSWELLCSATLRGTLASTLTLSSEGGTLGSISSATISNCNNGSSLTVLNLPWTLTYTGIAGTLPSEVVALMVTVRKISFNIPLFGGFVNGLYEGPLGSFWPMSGGDGEAGSPYGFESFETDSTLEVPKHSGSLWPSEGRIEATFSLSPSQTMTVR